MCHGPREPVVAEHARASRKIQAPKVFASQDRGSGVENVKDPPPVEDRECVDPMRELCIVIVASAPDQVVRG